MGGPAGRPTLSARFAALLLPLLVGWATIPDGGSAGLLFQATTDEVVRAYSDLIVDGLLFTPRSAITCWCSASITWATAQFASYATFGHRRPINAVAIIGLLLLANMSPTLSGQLPFLGDLRSRACSCWCASIRSMNRLTGCVAASATRPRSRRCTCAAGHLHHRRHHGLAGADHRGVVGATGGLVD